MKKTFLNLFFILLLAGCGNEVNELREANAKLKAKNDSLLAELNFNQIVPFIDFRDFQGELGKAHDIHFLAINKGGYVVDSVKLVGFTNEDASRIYSVGSDPFSDYITFNPDTAGEYSFRVFTRPKNGNNNVIQKFIVEISNPNHE